MAGPRADLPVSEEQYQERLLINEINAALNKIHDIFADAFAEGKPKPVDFEAQKLHLFTSFWEMLSLPEFTSMKSLNDFYNDLKRTYLDHLQTFCVALEINYANISINKRNLFLQLVNLHHVLIKQKFILSALHQYHLNIDSVVRVAHVCQQKYVLVDLFGMKKNQAILTMQLSLMAAHLNALNYPEHKIECLKPQQATQGDAVEQVRRLLETLPSTDQINQATEVLQSAVKRKDKPSIQQASRAVMVYVEQMRSVKKQLNEMLALQPLELATESLAVNTQAIQQRFSHVDQSIINKGRELIAQLNGDDELLPTIHSGYREMNLMTQKIREVCQSQSTFESIVGIATMGFWEQGWRFAATQTGSLHDALVKHIDIFIASYSCIKEVDTAISGMRSQKDELERYQQEIAEAIRIAKTVRDDCMNALTRVENVLLMHVAIADDSYLNFLQSFLGRHWWKMLLGGVGGGGTSTLIAILLTLEPTKLGILIAGASLVGTGLGAGAGATQDHFSSRPPSEKTAIEKSGKHEGQDLERQVLTEEEGELLPLIPHSRPQTTIFYSWLPEWMKSGSLWSRGPSPTQNMREDDHHKSYGSKPV